MPDPSSPQNQPSSSVAPDASALRSSTGQRRKAVLAVAAVLLAIAGGGWYLWSGGGADGQTTPAGGTGNGPPGARGAGGPGGQNRASPVVVEAATTSDFPVRLSAIGTVVPRTVVTVHSRVDGNLDRVLFTEGQAVRTGDLLAEIDPRPFEVALTQVQGQMGRDQALLANARADLSRYEGLAKLDAIPTQQLDTQRALVRQYEAAVRMDQGAVDNARLQLSYTRITAPADGRVGLRQVDPGNLVHSSDANGIVVITQVQPVTVIFPVAEADLGKVLTRLGLQMPRESARGRGAGRHGDRAAGDGARGRAEGDQRRATGAPAAAHDGPGEAAGSHRRNPDAATAEARPGGWQGRSQAADGDAAEARPHRHEGGADKATSGPGREQRGDGRGPAKVGDKVRGSGLAVEAWDRDGKTLLATGEVLTVDNQIDVTTGTVKVKAIFPNQDGALFPNQFVNVRLVVNELKDAVVIPAAAVQRGARGTFVWLLNDDKTVAMRPVGVGTADGDLIPVLDGLKAGEQIAVDGFDRLREGGKVEVVTRESRAVKSGPGKRGGKRGDGGAAASDKAASSATTGAAPAAPAGAAVPATAAPGARPQP